MRTVSPGPYLSRLYFTFLFLLPVVTGCSMGTSVFDVVDYREAGKPKRYRETFDEAYYDLGGDGNVDIVLRRREPDRSNPTQESTQVIHLHMVWQAIPGTTVAERTQINATVSYSIVSGQIGALFEGAGSLFISEDRRDGTLEGTLELGALKPRRRLSAGGDFFKRAELSGEFRATRNRRRVVRIINDMNRLFGPVSIDAPSRRTAG